MQWIRRLLNALGIAPGSSRGAQPSSSLPPAALGPAGARLAGALQAGGVDPASLAVLLDRGERSVHCLRVHGRRAIGLWRKLRELVEKTGCWPVLLGKVEMIGGMEETGEGPPAKIIEDAARLDASAWFEERVREEPESYEIEESEWPARAKPPSSFQSPYDTLSGKPLPEVLVAMVPSRLSWEAPAHLVYGGWNDCPMPTVHVALMKRWHDLYGAEVVSIADDIVEMQVARPPTSRAAAVELAREHFIYCTDIVFQGTETLEGLAATLLGSSVWYFWWD